MADYKNLRELVLSYSDSDWFKEHKLNIMFELNHCELHHIDSYYLIYTMQESRAFKKMNLILLLLIFSKS